MVSGQVNSALPVLRLKFSLPAAIMGPVPIMGLVRRPAGRAITLALCSPRFCYQLDQKQHQDSWFIALRSHRTQHTHTLKILTNLPKNLLKKINGIYRDSTPGLRPLRLTFAAFVSFSCKGSLKTVFVIIILSTRLSNVTTSRFKKVAVPPPIRTFNQAKRTVKDSPNR